MTHRLDRVRSRLQRTDVHVSGSSVKTAGHEDDTDRKVGAIEELPGIAFTCQRR